MNHMKFFKCGQDHYSEKQIIWSTGLILNDNRNYYVLLEMSVMSRNLLCRMRSTRMVHRTLY